jgi:surfactin synthase thioesterase subunit
MLANEFLENYSKKSDFILEEGNYSVHLIVCARDWEINNMDLDFIRLLTKYWIEYNMKEGVHSYIVKKDSEHIKCIVKYGLIEH